MFKSLTRMMEEAVRQGFLDALGSPEDRRRSRGSRGRSMRPDGSTESGSDVSYVNANLTEPYTSLS